MIRQPEYRQGDPVSASKLDELRREVQRLGNITPIPPVFVKDEAGGIAIGVDPSPARLIPAITSSTIATGSYSTPGTGTVTRQDTGATGVTIKNPFSSVVSGQTYGVASGKFVWLFDDGASLWLVSADC